MESKLKVKNETTYITRSGRATVTGKKANHSTRWLLLLMALICWGPGQATAQVSVSAELDSARIMIGDQVRLQLLITHSPDVRVRHIGLEALEEEPKIELLSAPDPDTVPSDQDIILQQQLVITSFDSGYYRIPPIPVEYLRDGQSATAFSPELAIEVSTFPIRSDSASLAPIKNIITEPFRVQDLLPYAIGVAGIALIGFLVWYLLRGRHRRRPEPPPAPPRPAHEVAFEKLAALKAAGLIEQGEVKAYHSQLSHIVREYLENRFGMPALESTTDVIIDQLSRQELAAGWQGELRRLLQTADLVKFAKAEPPATVHQEGMTIAENLVESTKEEPEPEEETEKLEKSEEKA